MTNEETETQSACAGIPWTTALTRSGTCQSAVGVPGRWECGRAGDGKESMSSDFPSHLFLPPMQFGAGQEVGRPRPGEGFRSDFFPSQTMGF